MFVQSTNKCPVSADDPFILRFIPLFIDGTRKQPGGSSAAPDRLLGSNNHNLFQLGVWRTRSALLQAGGTAGSVRRAEVLG